MFRAFACTFDENGILTSLRDPADTEWNTNFLQSFGETEEEDGLSVRREWSEEGDGLLFRLILQNDSAEEICARRLKLKIAANTDYVREQRITYYERVMQHACICGNSSFLYWHRPSGEGRFLALLALGGVSLAEECSERPYAVRLSPVSVPAGGERVLSFRFLWMKEHGEIQRLLAEHGGVGVEFTPGLVIPEGLTLRLHAFTGAGSVIRGVVCEGGEVCRTNSVRQTAGDTGKTGLYEIRFDGYGERLVRIAYEEDGEMRETRLLCYATKPLAHLIDSAAAHIAEKQRYTGDAWYDGLFSQWSLKERRMTTPDDTMGLPLYSVSADDPGLCKAPFIAEKNVFRPDPDEIAAVEYYIEHFLWGGLQRTDEEDPYPWGVIGSDTWKQNRESENGWGTSIGQERMWRTFDYTHLIQLYYNMYRIAKAYPDLVHYLDADGYLERARKTALAFFEVPYSIYMHDHWDFTGWTDWAFKQGNFHEHYILPLTEACGDEKLREYWEAKVKYMIYDNPLPYGSEMWFDTTAFESTEAAAHYAVLHGLSPDEGDGWYDKNLNGPGKGGWRKHDAVSDERNREFLRRQMTANIACRGSQMRDYTLQGSDFRRGGFKDYRLSYMSQMGGAAVLDYALNFAGPEEAAELLRLGYASLLSSWCLVNLGADDPFYPAEENEGAAGWAFQPEEGGRCWTGLRCARGPWEFDGEIHSGFSGAVYAACCVLAEDPAFGTVCYGGRMTDSQPNGQPDSLTVIPADGVGRAFFDVRDPGRKLRLTLDRDALDEIRISRDMRSSRSDGAVTVRIRNITGDEHDTVLAVNGVERTVRICGGMTEVVL